MIAINHWTNVRQTSAAPRWKQQDSTANTTRWRVQQQQDIEAAGVGGGSHRQNTSPRQSASLQYNSVPGSSLSKQKHSAILIYKQPVWTNSLIVDEEQI